MFDPSDPSSPSSTSARSPHWHHITLAQLQRVKDWREAHRAAPAECHIWELVLTVWLMGWLGWLPAYTFEAVWAYPLCVLGILAPRLYVYARARAHASGRLRCDWLDLVG